jgi:uncharacterized protein YeaO (DUF488 family)
MAHDLIPATPLPRVIDVQDASIPGHDYRILVAPTWPIGPFMRWFTVDEWARDLLPSRSLRSWFANNPDEEDVFLDRYLGEIRDVEHRLVGLCERAGRRAIALVVDDSPVDAACAQILVGQIVAVQRLARVQTQRTVLLPRSVAVTRTRGTTLDTSGGRQPRAQHRRKPS